MDLHQGSIKNRYATVAALIVLVIVAIYFVDKLMYGIIAIFFPSLISYAIDISELTIVIISSIGAYVIYRVLLSIVGIYALKRKDASVYEISRLVLRILLYATILVIALTAFGINLTNALAGGAIGGIIVGLAAQTITTSILSGTLLATSRTLVPGKVIMLKSSYWGSVDIVCRISHVTIIYTEVVTQNGQTMRLPNSLLFNYTLFTYLDAGGELLNYTLQVSLPVDVPAKAILEKVRPIFAKEFAKRELQKPDIYLTVSDNFGMRTFTVIIYFKKFSEMNSLISLVNETFDDTYSTLAKKAKK